MTRDLHSEPAPAGLPELGGRYIGLSLLSERQMTCAFSAVEASTGRVVFIKMIRESKVGDETAERLFANEVGMLDMLAASWAPIPLVPVIETGVWQDRAFFVQPLLSGFNLRAVLTEHGVLAGRSAFSLIEGCLKFLHDLHSAGVAHGDVSPDNIFIETDDSLPQDGTLPVRFQVRLLDYNSARRIAGLENRSEQLVFLKLPYAAPELAQGSPLSAGSDLYSLGVVFYEILAGERPYEITNMRELAAARYRSVPPIRTAGVPAQVESFLRSLMSPDPTGRPGSTAEALRTLFEFRDIHRWLSQTNAPPLALFTRRPKSHGSDERSDPYEALLGGGASAFGDPITRAVAASSPFSEHHIVPRALSSADRPTATEEVMPVVASAPACPAPASASYDRDEVSMAYSVPVASRSADVEKVDFSVFAPASISPGTSFVLEVWAYVRENRAELLELASRHGRVVERGSRGPIRVGSGSELTLVLRLDGFNIADPVDSFFWSGDTVNAPFIVEAPATLARGVHPGQANIMQNGMLLSRLVFDVMVGEPVEAQTSLGVRRQQIRSAFASYSSDDRGEVLRRVQGIAATGIDVFVDVLSLRSGDNWEELLRSNIRERDIFYLFWSLAARKSEWVEREWRLAMDERGVDHIHPVPLVDPRLAPPPPELSAKHFNDLFLACMTSMPLTEH